MLQGENIMLRSLNQNDLEFVNKWRNQLVDKILTQGFRLPISLKKDEEWINNKMNISSNNELYLIIEENKNPKVPIGLIQLIEIDYISGTAKWGFIIGDKECRGKGYSIEAPRLLFNYAFNVLNLRKLVSYNLDFNQATLKMHKKIGNVREEGCLKNHYYFNNRFWDIHILSFFKEDFKELKIEL